ncbi:hypothetical protein AQUCO_09100022v1 [Aquilegia coerulea]|uniref:Protein kinase domain-containing protein n=1 Tax=Aquilegia coerulea TaxID=218851 RepID=A0A2G5C5H8_AQUCA|nr:hypothetical protein AQUCO_09100022v1 [Aquilegia coerulea]
MDDIRNVANLEQNFGKLLDKMVILDRLRDQVERKSELHRKDMAGWLHDVEGIVRDVEEIQSKLNELIRHGFRISNLNDRNQLNMKIIDNLKAVNVLQEVGNASPEVRAFLSDLAIGQPKAFTQAELRSFTSQFLESNKIGSDWFGHVYKGKFRDSKQLTVKVLAEKDVVEEIFMAEVRTLSNTSHRNLVKLYGYCFERDIKALVYEYMENGSFDKILYKNPRNLEWNEFYSIAIKIAKGLAYLHDGCDDHIIHHDVKAANVLLDNKFSPKITDFGVAKLIEKDRSHLTLTRTRGTPGYKAPEMWIPSSRITCSCDVYSFGMMLFEVLGMRENNQKGQGWFPLQVWKEFEKGELDNIIEKCGIKEKDKEKARVLAKVALWCAQFTPELRPSMSTVVKMLEMEIPVKNPTDPFTPSTK